MQQMTLMIPTVKHELLQGYFFFFFFFSILFKRDRQTVWFSANWSLELENVKVPLPLKSSRAGSSVHIFILGFNRLEHFS